MEKVYKINEIFYSIQGEGSYAGAPMIFVRFSGCDSACEWCDTSHESYFECNTKQLVKKIHKAIDDEKVSTRNPIICFTGGEPSLQVDDGLIEALIDGGFARFHMETNGQAIFDAGVKSMWWEILPYFECLTVSPKTPSPVDRSFMLTSVSSDLKIVNTNDDMFDRIVNDWKKLPWTNKYLQPLTKGNPPKDFSPAFFYLANTNIEETIELLKTDQRFRDWKLSLQLHKILNVR